MKVIALQASPNTDGLTATTALAALRGAEAAGAETELIHLRKQTIEGCRACGDGWGICRRESVCVIEDDFAAIRESIGAADALVIALPVYFGEPPEIAKAYLDRLRRCEWGMGEASRIQGMPVMAIAAAGGSGGGTVSALSMLERYFGVIGLRPFDYITVTRFTRDHKLPMLEVAGRRLVEQLGE
jgi:multimeric flavodoxin WrbA